MGGTPVFEGTRVPLQNLIDSLEGGESIDDFMDGYPSVTREQVIAVIEAGKLADLVVLGRDPYKIDPSTLINVPIERTMVGGEWKFVA